jgi:4'-phosphopantetheinyl transferase
MITQYFTPQTALRLQHLPKHQQSAIFFHYWTRREAYLKAIGIGFTQTLHPSDAIHHHRIPSPFLEQDSDIPAHWMIQTLTPQPGYSAALAVEAPYRTLHGYQFPMYVNGAS